jgi:hypothetical protein
LPTIRGLTDPVDVPGHFDPTLALMATRQRYASLTCELEILLGTGIHLATAFSFR